MNKQTDKPTKHNPITRRAFALSSLALAAFGLSSFTTVSAADQPVPKPDGKPADMTKPVKVFIMEGQANMIGMGKLASLEAAVKEKKKYPYLVDTEGKWIGRKDVRLVFYSPGWYPPLLNNQWLGINNKPQGDDIIGPEDGIGNVVGNAIDEPVMLLKVCISNRVLAWDLLPPGSERFVEGDKVYAGYKDRPDSWPVDPAKGVATEPPPWIGRDGKPIQWWAGLQYDSDVAYAKKLLADLGTYYPGATKYEVAGFFFWQGEKDGGNPIWAANYEKNLVAFIKALRKDFNAPNAKFVLATMGEAVKGMTDNTGKVLEGHLAVSDPVKHPEFKGNVATVYTHDMAQGGSGNRHYGGNAEVFMDVGEAMGKAMVELLKNK